MEKNSNVVEFRGYKLLKSNLESIPMNDKILINTISPNSYGLAETDPLTMEALKGSDVLILDGLYFGLAPLLLNRKYIRRITGWDSFIFFSRKMNEKSGKVFFLGSTPQTLQKIRERYSKEFPDVKTESYSPPFKPEFSEEDNLQMVEAINDFAPDVLFVGMTAPKQEKWSYRNKYRLNVHVISTIGNVFDWYAGNSRRPGKIWINLGLEWFARIFMRPEILKRNLRNQMLFLWHLFLAIILIKKFR